MIERLNLWNIKVFLNFDQVFQNTVSAYAIISKELRFLAVNHAYTEMVGQASDGLLDRYVFDVFPETTERQARIAEGFAAALAGTPAQISEIRYPIPHHDEPVDRWWTIYCSPLDIEPHGFLCQIEDVTEVVQSRQRRDVYASELQHRIGNVLNVVQVLARRTSQTAQTHAAFLAAFDGRINALGKTYAHLSGDNWNGMSLKDVLDQQLLWGIPLPPQSILVEGPDWGLSVIHAQAFTMAVHELVINAVKAGALGHSDGKLHVSWGEAEDGSQWFHWLESGLQALQKPERKGFGTQMLLTFLPSQLGGTAEQVFTPTGMQYRLTIPADVAVRVNQGSNRR